MPQCIAAVFKAALNALWALFCPPKGRHSAERLRRRRSTRVRRYAPRTPAAPAPLPSHPAARKPQASAAEPPRPKPPPSLKPPTVDIDADEIALVRPYYTAQEPVGEAERIQNRATACLRQWGADLWFNPDPVFRLGRAPAGTRVYTLDDFRDPDPDPVAAPPPDPASDPDPELSARPDATFHVPARMNELPHLSRIRARQQERLARNLAGVIA